MNALLEVQDLHVAYGNVEALHGVSLRVNEGSIVTVIGPNGAGKTTLLAAIMGLLPVRGEISYAGASVARSSVEQRVATGLCLVPERRELFACYWEPSSAIGRATSPSPERAMRFISASRGSASDAPSSPARFPAASGRCWRSGAR